NSLTERALHLLDCRLAALVLGDLLVLTATAGGDLADQSQVAALKLAGGELLRRNGGTAAAPPSALGAARRRGGRRCGLLVARSGRASGTPACRRAGAHAAAGRCAQRLKAALQLVDLVLH